MTLRIFNTATRTEEDFIPQNPPNVTIYNCGPTVYNFAHIGNLRAYIFADVLRRTLEFNGYVVNQVINITDVGHLVSDADDGEDKMIIGATREGKSVEEIISMYTNAFYADLEALNILAAKDRGNERHFPRASHHITEQISLINKLNEEGYTYTTSDGVYFDTSKFRSYSNFARLDVRGMKAGSRVDMGEKKNLTDFALWKFSPLDDTIREQEWNSPLGIVRKGFPGWHIECSAMVKKYLGETIDIHTGGIDHIPVHHTNEIAQSECANGKPLSKYWMHSAFMNVDGQKMSKSLGNTYRLSDLAEHGISPMAFRYWLLTASYRTQVNFTWDTLKGAQTAYNKMIDAINLLPEGGAIDSREMENLMGALNNDLHTPWVISRMWQIIKDDDDELSPANRKATIIMFIKTLGLNLTIAKENLVVSNEIQTLLEQRIIARDTKNFTESDRLRDEIKKLGYDVKDTPDGQELSPI